MTRSIVIVNNTTHSKDNENEILFNTIKNVSKNIGEDNFLICKTTPFMLYFGKIYNPPIYKNILVFNQDQNEDYTYNTLTMIWNMTMVNGIIIIASKYRNFFSKFAHNINKIDEYVYIEKKTNLVLKREPKNKYPPVDFIIMGTQKSGTTSAQINLAKHPDICLYKDEIHYFDLFLSKGLNWYKSHFDYNKKVVGEKTPELMYLDSTYPYIQYLNPSIKIILFLRDPIDRAFSAWKMMKNDYEEKRSFEECIEDELTNRIGENRNFNTASFHYLQRGLYYAQIKKILEWFPIQNVLVLFFENIINNATTEYNKIYRFLNLREYSGTYTKERVSQDTLKIDPKLYNRLIDFFRDDVEKLEEMFGYKTGWLKQMEI